MVTISPQDATTAHPSGVSDNMEEDRFILQPSGRRPRDSPFFPSRLYVVVRWPSDYNLPRHIRGNEDGISVQTPILQDTIEHTKPFDIELQGAV